MANSNRQTVNRHNRLKRRRQEVRRFIERCALAVQEAEKKGAPKPDFTTAIQHFKSTRK